MISRASLVRLRPTLPHCVAKGCALDEATELLPGRTRPMSSEEEGQLIEALGELLVEWGKSRPVDDARGHLRSAHSEPQRAGKST